MRFNVRATFKSALAYFWKVVLAIPQIAGGNHLPSV
jgi:hypothetical protein